MRHTPACTTCRDSCKKTPSQRRQLHRCCPGVWQPLQVNFGGPASFANYGALVNDGSITANQTAGAVTWTQAGERSRATRSCPAVGHTARQVRRGPVLRGLDLRPGERNDPAPAEDHGRRGGLQLQGDNYNGTTLGLDASTVVNDGTIVLEAQGSGSKTGGPAVLKNGALVNNGTILAEVKDPSWPVQYEAGLTNKHSGTLSVTGGEFADNAPAAATNDGTVKVGSGALYLLESGAAFTNKSDGTIVPEVSSPKSLGQFQVVSPCCAGPGRFIAGGSLDPVVVGQVSANTDLPLFLLSGGVFKGTFAHLAKPFTADYAHETETRPSWGRLRGIGQETEGMRGPAAVVTRVILAPPTATSSAIG